MTRSSAGIFFTVKICLGEKATRCEAHLIEGYDFYRDKTSLRKEIPLELNVAKKEKSLKSLIELGVKGYFPLFHPSWTEEIYSKDKEYLTKKDRKKAKEIMNRLLNHRGIERKKIILLSLKEEERKLFIRSFMDMVEDKIIDKKPELQ